MCIYMCIHTHTHAYLRLPTLYTYMNACMHACVQVYIYTCIVHDPSCTWLPIGGSLSLRQLTRSRRWRDSVWSSTAPTSLTTWPWPSSSKARGPLFWVCWSYNELDSWQAPSCQLKFWCRLTEVRRLQFLVWSQAAVSTSTAPVRSAALFSGGLPVPGSYKMLFWLGCLDVI